MSQVEYRTRPLSSWLHALRSEDEAVYREAIQAPYAFGSSAVPGLVEILGDANVGVRARAVNALLHLGPEAGDAVPALCGALDDPSLRYAAVFALGSIGERARAAVPALTGLLRDNDPAVQKRAVWALGQIDRPRAGSEEPSGRTAPTLPEPDQNRGTGHQASRALWWEVLNVLAWVLACGSASALTFAVGVATDGKVFFRLLANIF
jgi:HEAT repeat protein